MAPNPTVRDVDPEEAQALLDAGAVLLDVREPDEWSAGHAPTAVAMPMGEVGVRHEELTGDRTIVVICRSGARSRTVAEALVGAGYDAVNFGGGMRLWAGEDLPVVADDGLPGAVI